MRSLTKEKMRDWRGQKVAHAAASPASSGGQRGGNMFSTEQQAAPWRWERLGVNFVYATDVSALERAKRERASTTSSHPPVSSETSDAEALLRISARSTSAAASPRGRFTRVRRGSRWGASLRTSLIAALFWQLLVYPQEYGCSEEETLLSTCSFIRQPVVYLTAASSVHQQKLVHVIEIPTSTPPQDMLLDTVSEGRKLRRRNRRDAHAAKHVQTSSSGDDTDVIPEEGQRVQRALPLHYDSPFAEEKSPAPPGTTTTLEAVMGDSIPTYLLTNSPEEKTIPASKETPCEGSLECIRSTSMQGRSATMKRSFRSKGAKRRILSILTICAVVSAVAIGLIVKLAEVALNKLTEEVGGTGELAEYIENKVFSLFHGSARVRMAIFSLIAGILGHNLLRQLTILLIVFCFLGAILGSSITVGGQALLYILF